MTEKNTLLKPKAKLVKQSPFFKNISREEWNAIYDGNLDAFKNISDHEWLKLLVDPNMPNPIDIRTAVDQIYLRKEAKIQLQNFISDIKEPDYFINSLDPNDNNLLDEIIDCFKEINEIGPIEELGWQKAVDYTLGYLANWDPEDQY